jgi:hypothetical protein
MNENRTMTAISKLREFGDLVAAGSQMTPEFRKELGEVVLPAIVMKVERMEEALKEFVEVLCGHDKHTEKCDCYKARLALAFDPLAVHG